AVRRILHRECRRGGSDRDRSSEKRDVRRTNGGDPLHGCSSIEGGQHATKNPVGGSPPRPGTRGVEFQREEQCASGATSELRRVGLERKVGVAPGGPRRLAR